MNKAAVNICGQIFVWAYLFYFVYLKKAALKVIDLFHYLFNIYFIYFHSDLCNLLPYKFGII